jgi:hypothetical protein
MGKLTDRLARIEALIAAAKRRRIQRVIIYRPGIDDVSAMVAENRQRFGNEHAIFTIPHNGRDSLPGLNAGPTAGECEVG